MKPSPCLRCSAPSQVSCYHPHISSMVVGSPTHLLFHKQVRRGTCLLHRSPVIIPTFHQRYHLSSQHSPFYCHEKLTICKQNHHHPQFTRLRDIWLHHDPGSRPIHCGPTGQDHFSAVSQIDICFNSDHIYSMCTSAMTTLVCVIFTTFKVPIFLDLLAVSDEDREFTTIHFFPAIRYSL